MFKKMFKKKTKPLPVEEPVEYNELIDEVEIEDEEEEVEEVPKKIIKKSIKRSRYNIGDIIPIQQVVGYQVIKSIGEDGTPSITSTDKISEAEILSFIYQED